MKYDLTLKCDYFAFGFDISVLLLIKKYEKKNIFVFLGHADLHLTKNVFINVCLLQ